MTERAGADLIGYIHIADVLDTDQARRNLPLDHRWIRPLGEIRATATLQTALATLRRSGSHLARLIDDNGQTQAVIALEDILEELVGEVMDATRRPDDLQTRRPGQRSFLTPSRTALHAGLALRVLAAGRFVRQHRLALRPPLGFATSASGSTRSGRGRRRVVTEDASHGTLVSRRRRPG